MLMPFNNNFSDGIENAILLVFFVPVLAQVIITSMGLAIDLTIIGIILSLIVGIILAIVGEIIVNSTWQKGGLAGITGFLLVYVVLKDWFGLIIQIISLLGPLTGRTILENR